MTITTTAGTGYTTGQTVTISGVGMAGYNGTFTITSVPTATTFTYTDPSSGLANSGGGTATVTPTFNAGSTTSVTASGGVATFSNLALGSAGSYTLSPSATGGLTGLASSAFNVTLVVVNGGFQATPTGFTVTFSQAFNPATINLTGPTGTDGPVAVTLVGNGSIGPVSGSLYLDPTDTQLTFVKTVVVGSNGLPVSTGSLPLGAYTVTLVSGSAALTTTSSQTLDGNSDGLAGDNYTHTFNVVSSSPAAGDVLLPSATVLATVPDFARGPNTPNLTIASSNGATESGNTVTITTTSAHAYTVGQTVVISGVTLSGYNGTFTITGTPTATSFTYTDLAITNAASAGSGSANVPAVNVPNNSGDGLPVALTVLAPVQTVTFGSVTTGTFTLGFNSETTSNISVGATIEPQATFSISPTGATHAGTTVTITTTAAHGFVVGQRVTIAGVGVSAYNGTFTITAVTATTFKYTALSTPGSNSGGGSATGFGAFETGTTATIATTAAHGLSVGQTVTISGVGVSGYNGTFAITARTATTFSYTASSGLGNSGGGTATLTGASLATAIQSALGALSVVGGSANVAVTGTGPFTVTFAQPTVANPNLMTVATSTLAGGPPSIVNPNAPASVTSASLVLSYNATLLNITGATVNAALAGASLTVSTSGVGAAAQATITFTDSSGVNLGTLGSVDLGGLIATVPSTAPYKSKDLLHFVSESLNGGALTAAGVDGYQVVAYQGDTDGDGGYTSNDVTVLNQVVLGTNPGFAAYRLIDPVLIGGVSGGTSVSAADSSIMTLYVNNTAEPVLPNNTGVPPSSFAPGPDPTVSIPTGLAVGPDGTVTVPVNLDDARPAGSTGLTEAELALTYDPSLFTVSAADVHLGTVPAAGSGWTLSTVVDPRTGQIAITLLSQTPIATALGGSLVTITFHQTGTALSGTTPIALAASVDPHGQGTLVTALFDTDNRFVLSPAPSNGLAAIVSSSVWLSSPDGRVRASPLPGEASAVIDAPGVSAGVVNRPAESLPGALSAVIVDASSPEAGSVGNETVLVVPEHARPVAAGVGTVLEVRVASVDGAGVVAAAGAEQAPGVEFSFGILLSTSVPFAGTSHLVDVPMLALGRGFVDWAWPAGIPEDTWGRVLREPLVRTTADTMDNPIGDSAGTDFDWFSLVAARRRVTGDRTPAAPDQTHRTERAALDQSFAAMADEPEQEASEPGDE